MPSRRVRVPPGEIASDEPARSELSSLVAGLALVGIAALSGLALAMPGGTLGILWRNALGAGLGWSAYLWPVVLLALGIGLVRPRFDASYHMPRQEAIGWLLWLLTAAGILERLDGSRRPAWGALSGGGWIGYGLWTMLVSAIGFGGAWLTLGGLIVLGCILVFRLRPHHFWIGAKVLNAGVARAWSRLHRPAPAEPTYTIATRPPLAAASRPRPSIAPTDDAQAADKAALAAPAARPKARPVQATASGQPPAAPPAGGWQLPPVTALDLGSVGELSQIEIAKKVKLIEETLADFDVYAKVVQVNPGPTVTQFGLEPGFREKRDRTGTVVRREKIKVSEITGLNNDLALALAAQSIRIEAPVPGRQVVGLEVPNNETAIVSLRQLIESTAFQRTKTRSKLALALGENVSGQPIVSDLARMPHLLIAGATGSGKSVMINAIISCLLLHATPDELRLILVDPKRVEMTAYNAVPHLLRPVVVDVDKVVSVLKWAVHEMEERYKRFETLGVRNIEGYSKLVASRGNLDPLPFIVIIIDELADLMMLAPDDTERLICRLAQLARATGIHLVVATQRPSVDVITGLIKANFPTRISFATTSQVDSRTILDTVGAEKLLGRGDMLFLPTDAPKPIRVQGVYVSDDEIDDIVHFWQAQGPANYVEQLVQAPSYDPTVDEVEDELYDRAEVLAREHTRISASLLQRRLRVGYQRAARLVDLLEEHGVVGAAEGGGKSREVLHDIDPPSDLEPSPLVE